MSRFFVLLPLLLACCVGLHLPKSFTLLYLLSGLIAVGSCRQVGGSGFRAVAAALGRWWPILLSLLLFSVAYAFGMLAWGFWQWPADCLDLINAVLLPSLLALTGMQAASFDRIWSSRMLLAYALGGLLYVLIALALAREPWWAFAQAFTSTIELPWGSVPVMNVRSVEQNAYSALLLLPLASLALMESTQRARRWWGVASLVVALLGAHAVWSLNGRLGWLALLLATLPLLWHWLHRLVQGMTRSTRLAVAFAGLVAVCLVVWSRLKAASQVQSVGIWAQGFCDERMMLFGGVLSRLFEAPWGGRILRVSFSSCIRSESSLLLAESGGTHQLVHNVLLDVFYAVGLVPLLFLLTALVPMLFVVCRGFIAAWPVWDWQVLLRWGWLSFLVCQWTFQPLLYSDGLLYYWSFFVLGLLVMEAWRGFSDFPNVAPIIAEVPQSGSR